MNRQEQTELKPRPCKYCEVPIVMIMTERGRFTPCLPAEVRRFGSEALPKGTYFDIKGRRYDEMDAPNATVLYRSHWSDCPGAKEARHKR